MSNGLIPFEKLLSKIPANNVFASDSTKTSPVSLESTLKSDADCIYIVGQNLFSLTGEIGDTEDLKDALEKRLRRGGTVNILMNDPDDHCAVASWTKVQPTTDAYSHKHRIKETVNWLRGQLKQESGSLTVRVAALVPCSMWIVDPKTPRGLIVLTPIINKGAEGEYRPQIFLHKELNKVQFDYYWRHVRETFKQPGLSRPLPTRWQSFRRTMLNPLSLFHKIVHWIFRIAKTVGPWFGFAGV